MGNETSPSDRKQENPQVHKLSIECCAHSYKCLNPNCKQPFCQKIKRVLDHKLTCKRRTKGGCLICREISALCTDHVKQCKDDKCPVPIPFCLSLKKKMKRHLQYVKRLSMPRVSHSNTSSKVEKLEEGLKPMAFGSVGDEMVKSFCTDLSRSKLNRHSIIGLSMKTQEFQAYQLRDSFKVPTTLKIQQSHHGLAGPSQEGKHSSTTDKTEQEKPPFQQLFDALQTPDSDEQKLLVLNILNNNPLLMKEYLQHRIDQAQKQLRVRQLEMPKKTSPSKTDLRLHSV